MDAVTTPVQTEKCVEKAIVGVQTFKSNVAVFASRSLRITNIAEVAIKPVQWGVNVTTEFVYARQERLFVVELVSIYKRQLSTAERVGVLVCCRVCVYRRVVFAQKHRRFAQESV